MTDLASLISKLPEHEQQKLLSQVSAYKEAVEREKAQADFMAFVKMMWPSFIHGRHHALMAKELEAIANGKNKRLIIALPPRHTKSQFASYLFPAWFLGKYPDKKIIQASNTAELAVGFGRNVRNLVGSDIYRKVFPGVDLKSDSKAAGRWSTNHSGEYFAVGVGGTMTGKGADCVYFLSSVLTNKGNLFAYQVQVGDMVWTEQGFKPVVAKMQTVHENTHVIDGELRVSANHPIFVFGKGWVLAKDIHEGDALYTLSWFDNIRVVYHSLLRHAEPILEKQPALLRALSRLSNLGWDAAEMLESKRAKLRELWRSWYQSVRAMDFVKNIYRRHGAPAVAIAYVGQNQSERGLLSRELQMGGCSYTAKPQEKLCADHRIRRDTHTSSVVEKNRIVQGSDQTSNRTDVYATRGSPDCSSHELDTKKGYQESLGWLRNLYVQIIGSSTQRSSKFGKHLERFKWKSQNCFGIPLGVRRVITKQVEPKKFEQFINFTVADTHTFLCHNRLTHNCLIIDDPHSESEAKLAQGDPTVFDGVYEWYTSGPRQRLQPNGSIVIVATRWSDKDLTGKVLRNSRNEDEWKVIELPAILPSGNPLWPEFWSLEELLALKEELPAYKWNAQYQQTPTGEAGAIVKREWWRRWERDRPPACEFIIQSWDTAFTKGERSDYSACTTWGVFNLDEDENNVNIILLDAFKDKWEFPELKQQALASWKEWQPDAFVIEAKAAGAPLVFELRRMGIPVSEYTPSRGNDKFARLNSVTDLFASGKVWAPDKRWADEVIEEMARFPNAEHDDLLDSSVQALIRFRQGGFLRLQSDEPEEEIGWRRKKANY